MASWATKVSTGPEVSAEPRAEREHDGKAVAVMDANAIISLGAQARSLGAVLASTEEVLAEIRDATTRSILESLSIVRRAPTDDAVRAVAAFAARTGDLHQLSTEDIRLIALAYTYEAELHGIDHLRTVPVPVQTHGGRTSKGKLPGWGECENNAEWEAVDKVPDEGETKSILRLRSALPAFIHVLITPIDSRHLGSCEEHHHCFTSRL
jgi:RNA-binding protein NOB1